MRLIDEQSLETPFYGPRQMTRHLRREGYAVSRKRIGRPMCGFRSNPATDSAAKWSTRSGTNWSRHSALKWSTDSVPNWATFS